MRNNYGKSMMLPVLAVLLLVLSGCDREAHGAEPVKNVTGAGSTFVAPLMAQWAQEYQKETGVQVNYQSIGSGAGIKQIEARTVTFGASDKPLSKEELTSKHLVQFPIAIGGVVPVYNIQGYNGAPLLFTGDILAKIFSGQIVMWNDPQLVLENPDLAPVNLPISVVHRSDGSGTSFLFTNYLSQSNMMWQTNVGAATSLEWPVGLGAKGNEGLAATVQQTNGSIGYVEYAYAKKNNIPMADLVNKDGVRVTPNTESFANAAQNAKWKYEEGMNVVLTNQPGQLSWPITGATFILMNEIADDKPTSLAALDFFRWSLLKTQAEKIVRDLEYVSVPGTAIMETFITWAVIRDKNDESVYFTP